MNLEIDFTPELTNTCFAPLAVLLALYQDQKQLEPLQQVLIPMRNRYFEPAEKMSQILSSIFFSVVILGLLALAENMGVAFLALLALILLVIYGIALAFGLTAVIELTGARLLP